MSGKKLEKKLHKKQESTKKIKYNKKIISHINGLNSLKNLIEKTKNEYFKNSEPIATRKSSEMFLKRFGKTS